MPSRISYIDGTDAMEPLSFCASIHGIVSLISEVARALQDRIGAVVSVAGFSVCHPSMSRHLPNGQKDGTELQSLADECHLLLLLFRDQLDVRKSGTILNSCTAGADSRPAPY